MVKKYVRWWCRDRGSTQEADYMEETACAAAEQHAWSCWRDAGCKGTVRTIEVKNTETQEVTVWEAVGEAELHFFATNVS